MAFKDLCLIFISKRMQKSPWVGVQRKHTLRREAASLHQAAVGAGWAWGTTPWSRSGGEAGAAARGPAWLHRSVPQAGGLSGPLGFGGGLFHCHCHWPGKHTRLPPPPPPSGHCEGDCASGILFDVVGEQLEDGDFPENTVGVSLWGRSGGRGEREGLCPRLAKRHCSGCSPGREQLAG